MIAAGMLMCAWLVSIARYVPSSAIAVDLVLDGHAAGVRRYRPSGVVRPLEPQLAAVGVVRVHVVHVLREVVERVASGRRSAHPQLERRRRQLGERRVDLHPSLRTARES